MEAQIAALRAELLHKEQENERVQLQLTKEKEERERAERQVCAADKACHESLRYHRELMLVEGCLS